MTLEIRSFQVHQEGAGPGCLLGDRTFEVLVLLGRTRRARTADPPPAEEPDEPAADAPLYDASTDRSSEDQDGWADRGAAPSGRVTLTLEAFEGEDPEAAPRVQLLRTTIQPGTGGAGHERIPWGLPAGLGRIRLRLTVEQGRHDPAAVALLPATGTLEVVQGGDAVHEGEVDEAPSIYEVLQRRGRSTSSGEGAAGVVAHLTAQLRDLPAFFARAWGEPPYTPLAGEIGPDGQPATGLAGWQRQLIELMTGSFYAYSPRRVIQNLVHAVGRPLTAVCNNNVDITSWLRGATIPGWESGGGVGFNDNQRSIDLLATAAHATADRTQPAEPPTGAFVHDFRTADAGTTGEVDAAFRQWSLQQARPGSIFLYSDSTAPPPDDAAHINLALRVRRVDGQVEVQLFDTGAIEATLAVAPRALHQFGKALSEGGWHGDLERTFGTGAAKKCIAHVWFPVGPEAEGRALPAWGLWRPTDLCDAREGGAVATDRGRAYAGAVFPPSPLTEPTFSRSPLLWMLPDPPHPRGYPDFLFEGARRPLLHLAVTRRADAGLVYLSRPLRCGRPTTHLIGSVANLPAAAELEARWLLLVVGTWPQCLTQGFDPPEHQPPGTSLYVALQLANDALGVARHIRPQKVFDDPAFADRLQELWEAGLSRFYDAHGVLLQASDWPTAEAWRDAALDARLAEEVEAPTPDGLDDAIPLA